MKHCFSIAMLQQVHLACSLPRFKFTAANLDLGQFYSIYIALVHSREWKMIRV